MFATLLLLGLLPLAFGAQQTIQVGDQGLQFLPNTVYAGVGDTIQFQWVTPNHGVAQGDYDKPCTPGNSSFYSGVLQETTTVFTVTINNTNPIWIYCPVSGHCQGGMVAVINPPSGSDTLDGYRAAAANVGSSSSPANVQGGILKNASAASSSTSATATASTTTSASASTTAKSGGVRMKGVGALGVIGAVMGAIVAMI